MSIVPKVSAASFIKTTGDEYFEHWRGVLPIYGASVTGPGFVVWVNVGEPMSKPEFELLRVWCEHHKNYYLADVAWNDVEEPGEEWYSFAAVVLFGPNKDGTETEPNPFVGVEDWQRILFELIWSLHPQTYQKASAEAFCFDADLHKLLRDQGWKLKGEDE